MAALLILWVIWWEKFNSREVERKFTPYFDLKFDRHDEKIDLCSFTKNNNICRKIKIYAEVVTLVAGSLEAGGLPGYPEVL